MAKQKTDDMKELKALIDKLSKEKHGIKKDIEFPILYEDSEYGDGKVIKIKECCGLHLKQILLRCDELGLGYFIMDGGDFVIYE
jgi:hypothetical protein